MTRIFKSILIKMDEVEYRSVIKFYLMLNRSPENIMKDMRQAYGEQCPSRSTISRWIALFKQGRENVHQDYSAVGRQTEISDDKFKQCDALIRLHRQIKISELAEILKISVGSC